MPSDSMAAIIIPVISLQPSGTVLLLFNTRVLPYILHQISLLLSLKIWEQSEADDIILHGLYKYMDTIACAG